MLGLIKFVLLVAFQIILVQCLIPTLTVRKLDERLIQRKRQDTLEMCKIYEETEKLVHNSTIRKKREAAPSEDEVKVEKIIDKVYDDMAERGENVTYRHRPLNITSPSNSNNTAQNRRFNFAPKLIVESDDNGDHGGKNKSHDVEPYDDNTSHNWKKHWSFGIVPYFIDPTTYDNDLADTIVAAFDYFEKATCIRLQRLREKPTDQKSLSSVEWIYITNPTGIRQCVHSNERIENKGVQLIVFGYDCMSLGEIVHEVMHILGFSHEHTRVDRDAHITIHWDNIKSGYKKYFSINKDNNKLLSLPYDYTSVLHYPSRAFSKNGQVTLSKDGTKLGQREGLSEIDVEKISLVFGNECVKRNKDYLSKTCRYVNNKPDKKEIKDEDIKTYFKDKIWPFGTVHYKFRDAIEFTLEEKYNLKAVFEHIQNQTCIQFINLDDDNATAINDNDGSSDNSAVSGENDSKPNKLDDVEFIGDNGERSGHYLKGNPILLLDGNNTAENFTRVKRSVNSQPEHLRRHFRLSDEDSSLILARSKAPGCQCPASGKSTGEQVLHLNTDCFNSVNDLIHVFVHVLGLDHQHNMYDRDNYIYIDQTGMSDEEKAQFNLLPREASVGEPYDYHSVMHYPWLQIKSGAKHFIYPIWNDGWVMGHWQGLSATDVKKISKIYEQQCADRKKKLGS